jgi:hypothetical protein
LNRFFSSRFLSLMSWRSLLLFVDVAPYFSWNELFILNRL